MTFIFKVYYTVSFEKEDEPFHSDEITFQVGDSSIPSWMSSSIKTMSLDEEASFKLKTNQVYTKPTSLNEDFALPIPQICIFYHIHLLSLSKPLTNDRYVSKKRTLQKGNEKKPSKMYQSTCKISYKFEDEESFKEIEIILGSNDIYWGIEIALFSMEEGERSIFEIDSRYLIYKHDKNPSSIKSQNVEIFLSKLTIDVPDSPTKKRDLVKVYTNKGIQLREQNNLDEAIEMFNRANKILKDIQFDKKEHVLKLSLEATLFVNKNMALMEKKEYKKIIKNADIILSKYPKFLDALWIRGRSKANLNLFNEAKEDFETILNICQEEEDQWIQRRNKLNEMNEQLNIALGSANNRISKWKSLLQQLIKEKNPDPNLKRHYTEELNKSIYISNGLLKQLEELKKRKHDERKEYEKTHKADKILRRSTENELAKLNVPILYDYFMNQFELLVSRIKISDKRYEIEKTTFLNFIKDHLPSYFDILSGEIWDSYGNKSPHFQYIIVNKDSTILPSSQVVLFETVSAIIEIIPNITKKDLISIGNRFESLLAMNKEMNNIEGYNDTFPIKIIVSIRSYDFEDLKKDIDKSDTIDGIFILEEGSYVPQKRSLPPRMNEIDYNNGFVLSNIWFLLSTLPRRKFNWSQSYIIGNWNCK